MTRRGTADKVRDSSPAAETALRTNPCTIRNLAPQLAFCALLGVGCSTVPDAGLGASSFVAKPDILPVFGKVDASAAKDNAAAPHDVALVDAHKPPADVPADAAVEPLPDAEPTDAPAPVDVVVQDFAAPAEIVAPPDVATLPDIPGCVPKPETCNELDDDCNGLTDETCDDGEPCTVSDSCNGTTCYGKLKNCSDGDACTADGCSGGSCQHTAKPCDDKDACTADSCDPASGCVHTGTSDACDDGDPCTTGDNCGKGYCAGTPQTCDDSNPCTNDSCDKAQGCLHANNSATCDDGNPCTATDLCSGGKCVGSGGKCDDGNACTDDTCDGGTCASTNNAATCNDGNACTTGDVCAGGSCTAGAINCDDGLDCTADSCNAGSCVHTSTCAANQACDPATKACKDTGCALPANACGDGNQNRYDCGGARVIGRKTAIGSKGYKKSDTTCDSLDYMEWWNKCYDSGYDHTYRIFLRKNEKISISYTGFSDDCWGSGGGSTWAEFKVIQASSGCGDPINGSCPNYSICSDKSSGTYVAPAEGWYVIVADSDDFGAQGFSYTLTVKLDATTCQTAGCECP